jgi:hypothetical protein
MDVFAKLQDKLDTLVIQTGVFNKGILLVTRRWAPGGIGANALIPSALPSFAAHFFTVPVGLRCSSRLSQQLRYFRQVSGEGFFLTATRLVIDGSQYR